MAPPPPPPTDNFATTLQRISREFAIVIYSYNKTNEIHLFPKFIFVIELYMFPTVSLSIIRSLALYYYCLLAGSESVLILLESSQQNLYDIYPLLCVQR